LPLTLRIFGSGQQHLFLADGQIGELAVGGEEYHGVTELDQRAGHRHPYPPPPHNPLSWPSVKKACLVLGKSVRSDVVLAAIRIT